MPDQITSRGTNSQVRYATTCRADIQGNSYDTRVNTSTGSSGYHYSNTNGSYHYQNTNGSTYTNFGNGYSKYTSPSGASKGSYSSSSKK